MARQRAIDASDEENRPAYRIGGQVGGALIAAAVGPSFGPKLQLNLAQAPLCGKRLLLDLLKVLALARHMATAAAKVVYERAANIIPTAVAGGVVGGLAPVAGAGAGKAYEAFRKLSRRSAYRQNSRRVP